jgi:hypothetical protein
MCIGAVVFMLLVMNGGMWYVTVRHMKSTGKIHEEVMEQKRMTAEQFASVLLLLAENREMIGEKSISDREAMGENERQLRIAQWKLDVTRDQLAGITRSLSEIESLAAAGVDEQILDMMIETIIADYIERGFEYFRDGVYEKAYESFTKGLKYKDEDRSLRFYQLYSLYLSRIHDKSYDEEIYRMLSEGIDALNGEDRISTGESGFSEDEMRQKLSEMAYNIRERRERENVAEAAPETIEVSI